MKITFTREVTVDTPDYASMSPSEKLAAIKAMGFVAFWEQHQPDCEAQYSRGIRCICVPPGTSWRARNGNIGNGGTGETAGRDVAGRLTAGKGHHRDGRISHSLRG